MDNRSKDFKQLIKEDGLGVNDDIYPAQVTIAWKQSGMSRAGGRRPSLAVRNARATMSCDIADKVKAGTPLTLQEMSWLTVVRLYFGYTLDAGGAFRRHMGDYTPGPCEGLN